MAGILSAHKDRVVTGPHRLITVARSSVWKSALHFFSRKLKVQSKGPLTVTFLDATSRSVEDGLDGGGLRREFFRLLFSAMFTSSGLFTGMMAVYYHASLMLSSCFVILTSQMCFKCFDVLQRLQVA